MKAPSWPGMLWIASSLSLASTGLLLLLFHGLGWLGWPLDEWIWGLVLAPLKA